MIHKTDRPLPVHYFLNIAVLLLTYIISRVLASGTDISNEIKDKE